MKPLTREEFQDAIQKGLGRVIMHLREYGIRGVKEDILNACLHPLAYDSVDAPRVDWLISIIDLTGKKSFYRRKILKALSASDNSQDIELLFDLARVFAQQGCAKARKVIYKKIDKWTYGETVWFAKTLWDLDGIDGFIHIVEILSKIVADERTEFDFSLIYGMACDRFGKESIRAELSRQVDKNERMRYFLEIADKIEQEESEGRLPDIFTYKKILSNINEGVDEIPACYSIWGWKFASQGELEQLFERFLAETRREQLLRYLWVFRGRELPALNKKVFELAALEDEELQKAAINALSNSKDSSIRDLAIRLIRENRDVICRNAIRLFEKNYQPGDHELIESVLSTSEDREVLVDIVIEILGICEANPLPELTNCVLWAYEQASSSFYREGTVQWLIKMDCLPAAVREECRWDCSDEIREMVKGD